ncbi:hypothetical protein HYH03_012419 [Edaphochlamys debaryana]|uniref:Raffinose synthase n=1 Tax=Edaphochlamys debaryana TaxID=47281 RepID=A0A835XTZ6_9CHLO|nr:hypothetical protein HYH03_012419 [Edaphochlamys debaryana]|eukprot:KAG2488978.1 hypothetical protein HYH03_012419 [Edaphochlamys debaryana]
MQARAEGENGELVLRLESGSPSVTGSRWDAALYLAASWDPYELVDRGVAAAAALSGGARPRSTKALPPSLDGFGWCTWDAFYSTVSARGLADGLAALEAGGVSPQLLIIDDGWQMTDLDPPMRKAPPTELAEKLQLEGEPRRLLEATQDDYFYESQEVVAEAMANLPPGSLGNTVMPTLANLGPQHHAHIHSHAGSMDSATVTSIDVAMANSLQQGQGQGPAGGAKDARGPQTGPGAGGASAPARIDSSGGGVSVAEALAAAQRSAAAPTAPTATAEEGRAALTAPIPAPLPPASASAAPDASAQKAAQALWLARASQRVAGWLMGIATAGFLIFYQWVVEPAPPNSVAVRAFAAAAKGFLRPAMLSFFATASDFTRRLVSVRANGKFSGPEAGPDTDWSGVPEALGTVVAHIKRKFGVRYVYCWHGLPGYWAGVMPTDGDSPEGGGAGVPGLESHLRYASPTAGVLEIEPSMAWNPAVLAGIGVVTDPHRLYAAMHRYLSDCGVDGVKVDCQAGVGLIGSALGGGAALSATYQAALEGSVARHFPGNHVINCMCHSTENLYRMSATAIARASDDFYPRDPASSHPHIAACAYNSLFIGALLQPDWDMFHSKHPAARLHAVARAVSGGPLYVSDKPGEHDFALLHSLVLPDGSVFRGELPGRPTRDCLFADVLRDGRSLLKVWNTNPVTGVVGVFHLQGSAWDRVRRKFFVHDKAPPRLSAEVRPFDVDAFRPPATAATARSGDAGASAAGSPAFVVRSRNSGAIALLGGNQGVQVSLGSGEADVVTVAPLLRAGSGPGAPAFAALGLAKMVNGGGAVRSCAAHDPAQDPSAPAPATPFGARECAFVARVRGHGELLCYCSREPDLVLLGGSRLQPGVSYTWAPGVVAAGGGGAAPGGRLLVDLPRSGPLEAELRVVFRSFEGSE